MREIAVHDVHMTRDILQALTRSCNGLLILIDADDAPRRRQELCDTVRVTGPSQGTIHIDSLWICHQSSDRLFQHDADMMKLHAPASICYYES